MNTFQKPTSTSEEPRLSTSNIITYLGIDKRDGLVAIGKRLLRGDVCVLHLAAHSLN
jgi:hypothetical protein